MDDLGKQTEAPARAPNRQNEASGAEMTVKDLMRRKRWAHRMKYAIALIPLVIAVLAVEVFGDGASLTTIGAVLLVCYGAISAYRMGARWESRWSDLADGTAKGRS